MCLQKAVGIGYCSCYRRRTEVALATMGRKRGCRGGKKVAKKPAYVLALLCCLVGCAVGLMSVSCAVCCVLCVPVRRQHAALDFDRGAVRLAALVRTPRCHARRHQMVVVSPGCPCACEP